MHPSLFDRVKAPFGGHTTFTQPIGGKNTMATITKDTIVGDILDIAPETAPAFLDIGMHCLGCPASQMESVADAARVHGFNPEDVVNALNAAIEQKEAE